MSFAGNLLLRMTGPRVVRRFNRVSRVPAKAQQRLLREIVGTNADTESGRRHGFGGVTSFREFQERVPMVETGQRADGQFKVLRLTSDTSFAAEFAAERDLVGGARPMLATENVSPPRG
jgi:hypothetical protein